MHNHSQPLFSSTKCLNPPQLLTLASQSINYPLNCWPSRPKGSRPKTEYPSNLNKYNQKLAPSLWCNPNNVPSAQSPLPTSNLFPTIFPTIKKNNLKLYRIRLNKNLPLLLFKRNHPRRRGKEIISRKTAKNRRITNRIMNLWRPVNSETISWPEYSHD